MTRNARSMVGVLFLFLAVTPVIQGCSGRPPSELTKEQLDKQLAEDAASLADEDRLEAELKKKSRKK